MARLRGNPLHSQGLRPQVSLPGVLRLLRPQLSLQFYELGLEFNHGVCHDAGCQGCARGRGSRAGGSRIIDVLESPEHAPRNSCLRKHVVDIKIVKCFKYWVAKRHCRLLLRCNYRRCAKRAAQTGVTLLAPSSALTSYHSAPPSESQRSCAAAVAAPVSLSGSPAMKRPPTVETLFGPAAAIMVAWAWSGSVWGGTTSTAILLRLTPRTSMVFG